MTDEKASVWHHNAQDRYIAVMVEADQKTLMELAEGLNTRGAMKIRTKLRKALESYGVQRIKGRWQKGKYVK